MTSHVWITPAQALEKYRGRRFYMVAPTVVTLEELSAFKTIQEVITLVVFAVFSVTYLKEDFKWNYMVGFGLIVLAVFFIFKKW